MKSWWSTRRKAQNRRRALAVRAARLAYGRVACLFNIRASQFETEMAMAQININEPSGPEVVETPTHTHPTATGADHSVASGINMVTTLVILAVAVVLIYFLFQFALPLLGR